MKQLLEWCVFKRHNKYVLFDICAYCSKIQYGRASAERQWFTITISLNRPFQWNRFVSLFFVLFHEKVFFQENQPHKALCNKLCFWIFDNIWWGGEANIRSAKLTYHLQLHIHSYTAILSVCTYQRFFCMQHILVRNDNRRHIHYYQYPKHIRSCVHEARVSLLSSNKQH